MDNIELLTNIHDIKEGGVVELQYDHLEFSPDEINEFTPIENQTSTCTTVKRKFYAIVQDFNPYYNRIEVEYISKEGRVRKYLKLRN